MPDREGIELVRVLPHELPPGWRWRPQLGKGETTRLLQRYAELPESARSDIKQSGLEILARCVPPNQAEDSQETGLVVGYVQSGKTLSFTTVAALACDNSFPLIIVLCGTKTNLYSQTVKRLQHDLDLERPTGRWVIFEAQTSNPDLPRDLSNLLETWDEQELPGFPRKTALITVLKGSPRLSGLVNALQQVDLRGRPCLIIDDEADQHGLNTKVKQGDTSPVYCALLRLRRVIPRHTYIQYTATPQALLLIRVLDSLSPRFGWTLSAGTGYCGGQSFFEDGQLVRTIPDHDLDTMDDQDNHGPPDSLLEALRLFYVGVAAQAYHRGHDEPTQRYRSMLVHPSMSQLDHLRFKRWVDGVRASWCELLSLPPEDPDREELVQTFRASYTDLTHSIDDQRQHNDNHENLPNFEQLLSYLRPSMLHTRTWEVNSRRVLEKWTQDKWNAATAHILVGGENLGRGFTVNGLTITYMPRGRGGAIADTIQQRGRFFGYKIDYLGYCRVFLAGDVRADYVNYIDHESYVMEELRHLSQSEEPMTEWRRRMLLAQSLRPTRRSVMPNIYRHLRVSEWTQQTQPWSRDEDNKVSVNWDIIEAFLNGLELREDPGSNDRTVEQRNALVEHVPLSRVLDNLLVPMWFSWRDSPNFSSIQLAIQWYLRRYPDTTAAVYTMATQRHPLPGGGRRQRRIDLRLGRIVNLFQGAAPVTPLRLRGSVYPGDRHIHADDRLSVQIHNLDLTDPSRRLLRGKVPAIAVWVPRLMRVDVLQEMTA